MSEHFRENGFQWVDSEVFGVMDAFMGLERLGGNGAFYGTKEQCIDYIRTFKGWEGRKIIVSIQCIRGFKLEPLTGEDSTNG